MADEARARGARMLRDGGYTKAADDRDDKRMIAKAVHEHENHEHGGEHTKLKLKGGGKVKGGKPKHRPDHRARGGSLAHGPTYDQPDDADGNKDANSARARGGKMKGHGKVIVNVNAAPEKPGMPGGMPMMPHPPMAPPPSGPMAGPPGGGMPPGAMPPRPMPGPMPGGAPMAGPPGGMPPRPMMPPGGMPPPGMRASGGAMRDRLGRFTGGRL